MRRVPLDWEVPVRPGDASKLHFMSLKLLGFKTSRLTVGCVHPASKRVPKFNVAAREIKLNLQHQFLFSLLSCSFTRSLTSPCFEDCSTRYVETSLNSRRFCFSTCAILYCFTTSVYTHCVLLWSPSLPSLSAPGQDPQVTRRFALERRQLPLERLQLASE